MLKEDLPALVNATSEKDDYVFISYSHQDNKIVLNDLEELAIHGAVFWYDKGLRGGENWLEKVERIVMDPHCKGMIFYISKSFLQSKSILKEIKILHKKKEVCPEFVFVSVLVGIDNVFQTIKALDIEEEAFLLLANTFKSELIHLTKQYRKFYHMGDLIKTLEPLGVVKKRHKVSNDGQLKYINYTFDGRTGLQIISYNGMETNLIIPSYINGEPVISVADDLFSNNNNINSVILSEGLLEICDRTFFNCPNLTFVNLPTTLERMGYEAFRDCKSLQVIVIPTSTKYIADYCFYRCHGLETIIINSSQHMEFGFAAFSECIKLDKLSLPNHIKKIGHYCFNKCESLTSITLPEVIEEMGRDIFINCSNLQYVYIDTTHPISESVLFKFCNSLKAIIFNKSNIRYFFGDQRWAKHKHLFKIRLNKPSYVYVENNDTVKWFEEIPNSKYLLTIKSHEIEMFTVCKNEFKYDFKKNTRYTIRVRVIDEKDEQLSSEFSESFSFEYDTESFVLSEDKKELLEFKYCGESIVKIPDSVEIIKSESFANQQQITEVYFGKNVKIIEDNAFFKCHYLKKLHFNEGLECIGKKAFAFCIAIEKLDFPSTLKRVNDQAFICCDDIVTIDMSKTKLKEVDTKAYYRCINLVNVIWNDTITTIRDGAFRGCIKYDFSTLPTNLVVIGPNAFSFNIFGERLHVPEKVDSIGYGFLYYATGVTEITVDKNNTNFYSIDGVLYDKEYNLVYFPVCYKDKDYTLIDKCKYILPGSIVEGELLETIELNNVEEISDKCFTWCRNLQTIKIGKNIKRIGNECFNNCRVLDAIYIEADQTVRIGRDCFLDSKPKIKIYVKEKLIPLYKKRKNWVNCEFLPLKDC